MAAPTIPVTRICNTFCVGAQCSCATHNRFAFFCDRMPCSVPRYRGPVCGFNRLAIGVFVSLAVTVACFGLLAPFETIVCSVMLSLQLLVTPTNVQEQFPITASALFGLVLLQTARAPPCAHPPLDPDSLSYKMIQVLAVFSVTALGSSALVLSYKRFPLRVHPSQYTRRQPTQTAEVLTRHSDATNVDIEGKDTPEPREGILDAVPSHLRAGVSQSSGQQSTISIDLGRPANDPREPWRGATSLPPMTPLPELPSPTATTTAQSSPGTGAPSASTIASIYEVTSPRPPLPDAPSPVSFSQLQGSTVTSSSAAAAVTTPAIFYSTQATPPPRPATAHAARGQLQHQQQSRRAQRAHATQPVFLPGATFPSTSTPSSH